MRLLRALAGYCLWPLFALGFVASMVWGAVLLGWREARS